MSFVRALILFIQHSYFNPFILIFYIFIGSGNKYIGVKDMGGNVSKLNMLTYFLFSVITYCCFVSIQVGAAFIMAKYNERSFSAFSMISQNVSGEFGSWIACLGVAAVLFHWGVGRGAENNILGFFVLPILFVCAIFYLFSVKFPAGSVADFNALLSLISPFQLISHSSLLLQFIFMCLFNPFLLMSTSSAFSSHDGVAMNVVVKILTMMIFYLLWLGVVWGGLWISGAASGWGVMLRNYFSQEISLRTILHLVGIAAFTWTIHSKKPLVSWILYLAIFLQLYVGVKSIYDTRKLILAAKNQQLEV